MTILYEDNHLIAVEKPSGLPTQPSRNSTTSLEECVKAMIKTRDQKKGGVFLHAIHRLDGATSGIVLFAKTQKALSRLNEALREGQCSKEYLAIVQGEPPLGEMRDILFHSDHKALIVPQGYPGGKEAMLTISSVKPISLAGLEKMSLSLLHIVLQTGRYHQIRTQLANQGFPIIGDKKYGSPVTVPFGIALHHHQLAFFHPTRSDKITLSSTPSWLMS